jgi:hypothetical protein
VKRDDSERVILDLERGEPITGRISGEKGTSASFRGWVELVGWIERLPDRYRPRTSRDCVDPLRRAEHGGRSEVA